MSAVADKLREARKLIERGWCQDAYALDANGDEIRENDPSAVCWCASGALLVDLNHPDPIVHRARMMFRRAIKNDFIPGWNDRPGRTQAEVLAAFDKAIELAEREQ